MSSVDRLLSAAIFAAAGAGGIAAGAALGAGAAAGAAATGAGDGAAPAPPAAIWPSRAPGATVSPSLATISESTPDAGALTSMVTLSVSSSTKGSSAFTTSPAFLYQRPMVASETDSPRVGTRISVAMHHLRARRGLSIIVEGTRAAQAAKASSRNALSWARCLDMRPVAVAAEAGRPT